jgi:opacity protein-like surface antigen
MNRFSIAGGIAFALLSPICIQAQTSSNEDVAHAKAINVLPKSGNPIPTAHKPVFVRTGLDLKASVGYAYTSVNVPSASRLNLNGADVAIIADLSPFFGLIADSSYVRTANVFGTGHDANVLSYLVGPVLYPAAHEKIRVYVHGLIGGAKVDGVIPESGGEYSVGYANKLSWAVGGGIEYQFKPSFALRSSGDYQHTYFFNSDAAVRGQNGFRVVCSVVFSVWQYPKIRY